MSYCKVIVFGRLGKDPSIKYTPSGDAVCNFSVAVSKQWKDASGNKKEKTEWINSVAWRKTGELINQYFKKGDMILFEGELQTTTWDDKDGKKQYKTEILVSGFTFVPGNKKKEEGTSSSSSNDDNAGYTDDSIPF